MATKTYSKADISVVIGGTIVTNFVSVKVAYDEDKWTFTEGSHQEVTRSKKGTAIGTVTVTLPQSNSINGALTAYNDGDGLVEIEVKDTYGESIHIMPAGTIVKTPDVEYGDEAGELEWMMKGRLSVHFLGGNN